jgi:hypothetical protein
MEDVIETYCLWCVDSLLGNDRETNYTRAVTRQPPLNSNSGTVFSVRSVPKCFKQDSEVTSVESIKGLNLAAVKHTTVQVATLPF